MNTEISKFRPCKDSLEFRANFSSFKEAWEACPRGDWMLWIAMKAGVDWQKIFIAKALCSHTVIHLMKDKRSRNAVWAAFAYGRGKIMVEEFRTYAAAAYAAYAAYYAAAYAAYAADADAYAAYSAYYAAAYAAYAADADAYAAYSAYYAAAYAAYAAYYAAAYAAYAADADAYAAYSAYYAAAYARKENQLKTANICRAILTEEILKKI